jgi:hypothetical protein
VVADAVTYEPVSIRKFPANREKNREFRQIRPLYEILKADTRANSKVSSEIPYATEQGIISAEQGILVQEQGIFPVKSEIITVHTGAISSHRPSKLDRCTCPPARMREPRVGRIRAKAAGSKSTYLKKRYLRF